MLWDDVFTQLNNEQPKWNCKWVWIAKLKCYVMPIVKIGKGYEMSIVKCDNWCACLSQVLIVLG